MNIKVFPIFVIVLCSVAFGQLIPFGLEGEKVNSVAIPQAPDFNDYIFAGTESNGYFIRDLTSGDSSWNNIYFKNRTISSIFFQNVTAGQEEYPITFMGFTNQDSLDTTLVYKTMPVLSYWEEYDAGLHQSEINRIVSFAGFNYSDEESPQPVFCCANNPYIYVNRDTAWEISWGDIAPPIVITQLYANDSTLFACGTLNGIIPTPIVLKSIDQGYTWKEYSPFPDNIAYSITATEDSDTLYLGLNERVIKSTDGGVTWDSTSLRVASSYFTSIIINPLKSNHIYAGGKILENDFMMYQSENGGKTWEQIVPHWNSPVKGINSMVGRLVNNRFEIYIGTDGDGVLKYSQPITNVEAEIKIPSNFQLSQNYPNPFNPITTINYSLPEKEFITLKVYDILGEEVAILVNNEKLAGTYKVEFNASNLSSGFYFYRLRAGDHSQTKKLILLK